MKKIEKTRIPVWARVIIAVLLVLAVLISAAAIYAGDYYRADSLAHDAMSHARIEGGYAVFDGGGSVGFVFYPGGKVEYSAYAPLMQLLSERGITCVLVKMPLNLAVLGQSRCKDAMELAPSVTEWYIGGHSLGGAMASSVADEYGFSGLVLLAAYPTDTVSTPTLCIYGENDGVMDREKYGEGLEMLDKHHEIVLAGANHAGFGSYGLQEGDGEARLTPERQQHDAASAIAQFILYREAFFEFS